MRGARALDIARRGAGRIRSRAVLRDRAAALRAARGSPSATPVIARAASRPRRGAIYPVTREIIVRRRAARPRPTHSRRSTARRRCARRRRAPLRHRRDGAADRADHLSPRAGAGQPDRAQRRLGTYTNFVNLLDLCGLRAAGRRCARDGMPFGVTLMAPAGATPLLASIGAGVPSQTPNCRWAPRATTQPPLACVARRSERRRNRHRRGRRASLRHGAQRRTAGARRTPARGDDDHRRTTRSMRSTRTPPKPGLLRVDARRGHSIKLELWALSAAAFGKFVAAIPPPLGIGTIRLADGRA